MTDAVAYRYESRTTSDPDETEPRPIGDWAEQLTEFHPEDIRNAEYRNIEPLVPASKTDEAVAYHYERKSPVSGDWKEKVTAFDPRHHDMTVRGLTELAVRDETRATLGDWE